LYIVSVARRDELLAYLVSKGIECKVHYPVPIHLQKAAADLGYKPGDFPVCERQVSEIITIPAHQHVIPEQIDYIIHSIHSFYAG
jgi:dTDP-4-amino-4,6-dideoxygalactose transaminase